MGCDIHMYIELKPRSSLTSLIERLSRESEQAANERLVRELARHNLTPQRWIHYTVSPGLKDRLEGRDYLLFAVLAGVRNYHMVTPIAQPRGIPEDASEHVRASYNSWEDDAHSASWLLLAEITKFDWDQTICIREKGYTLRQACGWFHEQNMPELKRLADKFGGDRVRLVFWFDN